MKLSELFPKKYATGGDLQGKAVTLTIARIDFEEMRPNQNARPEKKMVVYFEEATKGVIAGRTLAYQIAEIVGSEDTDHWQNGRVTLYPQPMTVAGQPRIGIRARNPTGANNATPPSSLQDSEED